MFPSHRPRTAQHEPRAAALEERQRRPGVEQVLDAQRIAIEVPRACDILAYDRDLADAAVAEIRHGGPP